MRQPAGQEIPHLSWNPKVCYCINKNRVEQTVFTFYSSFLLQGCEHVV